MTKIPLPTGNNLLKLNHILYQRNSSQVFRHYTDEQKANAEKVPFYLEVLSHLFLNPAKCTADSFCYDTEDGEVFVSKDEVEKEWHSMLNDIDLDRRILHARHEGYECSSRGDIRFSALEARCSDGRTIEMHYQCDVKGYEPGGTNWKLGKGRPSLLGHSREQLWDEYYALWKVWCDNHKPWMYELHYLAACNDYTLADMFSGGVVNQARALAQYINDHPWDRESNLF